MPVTTAICYARVSTDDQAREGLSLDVQLADCRQYAARHNWTIGPEHIDVMSGKRDDRPAYQRLLAEVRSRRQQGDTLAVVVAALDRFGRRLIERVRAREELKALGVPVHSVRDGGEVSDLVSNILASVAQEEVRRLGERVSASRRYVRERGWMPVGRVGWGYQWREATKEERLQSAPNKVREIVPVEAVCVAEMFDRLAKGESLRSVARWVQALSVEQRGGRVLSYNVLRRVVRSPWYMQGQGVDGQGLVSQMLWDAAQAQLSDHRLARQASGRYLLSSLIKCPRCGRGAVGNSQGGKANPTYRCPAGHNTPGDHCGWTCVAVNLDELVRVEVAGWLAPFADPTQTARLRASWKVARLQQDRPSLQTAQRRGLEREIERERATLVQLTRQYASGQIEQVSYGLTRDDTLLRLTTAERALIDLEEPPTPLVLPDWEAVQKFGRRAQEVMRSGTVEQQRRILVELVSQAVPETLGYRRWQIHLTPTPLGSWLRDQVLHGSLVP